MTETLTAADEPAGCGCTCNPHHGLTVHYTPGVAAAAGPPLLWTYHLNATAVPMALNVGTIGSIGAGFRANVPTYATGHFR